jgi:hypothetical protein
MDEPVSAFEEVADEVDIQGKIDPAYLIGRRIDALGNQLNKLPRELMLPNSNYESGVTYSDIKQSFIDGVKFLACLVQPIDEKDKLEDIKDGDFSGAFTQFRQIIRLVNKKGMFYSKLSIPVLDETAEGVVYDSKKDNNKRATASENDIIQATP